ncbi:hypothetical protein [Nocardioides sp. BYT-33-1]|uniref:hypothetical protein n=1 Tax=Nocardioides sp. BYT-33-1 TaxID=3416952 RepID=UPI003F52AC41
MALTPQQIEHKLDQQGNDIESIDELLAGIQAKQATHDGLFADLQAKLTAHDGLFADLQATLTAHDTRFDTIDSQLGAIHAALAETLRRLPEPPVD